MDKKMKRHYQMPTIKVVAFQVEEGFLGSGEYKIGQWTTGENNQIVPTTPGVQLFERETQTGWTVS